MHIGRFWGRTAGVVVLTGAAFVGGVAFPDLHGVRDTQTARTVISLLPARLNAALLTAAHGDDNAETPYDTYADVLQTVQDNYYGFKDYGGAQGATGIVVGPNKLGVPSVSKVLPGTGAASAGVLKDDVLQSVNGKSVTGLSEADINTLLWGQPGTTVPVVVKRGGTVQTLTVIRALLPKDIDPTQMTYNGIRGMMGSLKDRYTRFVDPPAYKDMMADNQGEFVGIGAMLGTNKANQVYVVRVLPKGPALKAHVMSGDIILKVDGRSTLKMPDTDVVKLIRGEPNTKVAITVMRSGVTKTIVIPRGVVTVEIVQHAMIDPARKIGYISLAQFNEEADTQVSAALSDLQRQGMRGLVFDLRGNPGGLLNIAEEIASRFIPNGPVVWIKSRSENMQTMEALPVLSELHREHPQYPLVVLVDGGSASASEIVSGAIKDNKTGVLVGEKTFGKGLVQTILPLPDKSAAIITTQHYYTAAKHDIHHKGVMPDIVVKWPDDLTRKHFAFQRAHPEAFYDTAYDPQLQKGLSILKERLQVASAGPHAWPQ